MNSKNINKTINELEEITKMDPCESTKKRKKKREGGG
jgi:hypothetical protein